MTDPNALISGRWQASRRQVLRLSALAAAIPGALVAPAMAKAAWQPAPALLAVADTRFALSIAFASGIGAHADAVHDVATGLTPLWQNTLVPHWQLPGSVVCGVTTPAVWNGLREQARSAGRRAFRLAVHDDPDGPYDIESQVRQLVTAARSRTLPAQSLPPPPRAPHIAAPGGSPEVGRIPALVSWIIR